MMNKMKFSDHLSFKVGTPDNPIPFIGGYDLPLDFIFPRGKLSYVAYNDLRNMKSKVLLDVPPELLKGLPIKLHDKIYSVGLDLDNLVTAVGKQWIVDGWRGAVTIGNMKWHGVGTGVTAAASGDTALQTESTTILNPDSLRGNGTLVVGGSANILSSVATVAFDGAGTISEWGFLSQQATGGGVLFARITAGLSIAVVNGSSIQFTYGLTVG